MYSPSNLSGPRIAVVGGGILGLTLANRLHVNGATVTLFEASNHLGGLADAWKLGDITWDRHYHVTLLSDSYTRNMLAELGLERHMRWVETKTGFFTDGQMHSVSNAIEFLRFPPLTLVEKLRLGWTIFYGSKIKNWAKLEGISVEQWLRFHSGSNVFNKMWLPLLKCKLGANYQITSAAFIWATIARLYAARRSGLKKEMFGYVPGGYAQVHDRYQQLLESRGVDLRMSHPIANVRTASDAQLVVTHPQGQETFDQVVMAIPSSVIPKICPELSATESATHNAVRYLGIVCASVVLSRPLAGFYVTNITDEGIPFTGVIEMTALVDPQDFQGRTLVYLPHYVSADDPLFEESDQRIRERAIAGLQRMYPDLTPQQVLAFQVSRVRQVMPIPTLNYSHSVPKLRTSVPNLFVANSTQIVNGTLNVNETVKLAEQAATIIRQSNSVAPRLESQHAAT